MKGVAGAELDPGMHQHEHFAERKSSTLHSEKISGGALGFHPARNRTEARREVRDSQENGWPPAVSDRPEFRLL